MVFCDVWNGVCCFLREEKKEMFRDMGSKIYVFSEYGE